MGYYPQESLYKHYKYHGYTVRGTPNCPLIHIFDFQDQDVFIFCRPGMWICLCVLFQGKGEEKNSEDGFFAKDLQSGGSYKRYKWSKWVIFFTPTSLVISYKPTYNW